MFLYGAEKWKVMETEREKLAAMEMDVLRRLCKISLIERIRNERIKEMLNVKRTVLVDDLYNNNNN